MSWHKKQAAESPHITAFRKQAKLNRLAAKRFRIVDGVFEGYAAEIPAQDVGEIVAAAATVEIANAERGQLIEGHGVFIGTWAPKDHDGNSLGKVFNVFAAPHDLRDTTGKREACNYDDAVAHIAELRNWNGFDGENYESDREFCQALKDGTYSGGWIIPPRELLDGRNMDNTMVQPDNLFAHVNKGDLKDSFVMALNEDHSSGYSDRYWSSTARRDDRYNVFSVCFRDATYFWGAKDYKLLSCRPVRLEPKL